jgi:hypothetical protein
MASAFDSLARRVTSSRRRTWATGFAIFFILLASWSFATPLTGAPDEPAHMMRAASVVRGQINGPEVPVRQVIAKIPRTEVVTGIRLPERYKSLELMPSCWAMDSNVSAGCAKPMSGGSQVVSMTTAAGRYNPAYYLAIGWPTLFLSGPTGLYAMRLISAAICAALLASAFLTATEWRRRGPALLGLFTAATPMVLFLGGVVNPNSVEIAAGILAWAATLSIFMSPDPRVLNHRLARAGTASAALFCIRPLGLIWVASIIVCGLLTAERGTLRAIVHRRAFWLWSGVSGLAFVLGEVWNMTHPDHSSMPKALSAKAVVVWSFHHSDFFVNQMIGNFGWLTTPIAPVSLILWLGSIVGLVILACTYSRRRETLALLGIAAGIFLIPLLGSAAEAKLGPIWQGRYLLAFAVGLPMLSAFVIAKRDPLVAPARTRLVNNSMLLLGFANIVAFYWALHRYLVGSGGSILSLRAHWEPPGTWPVWVLVYAVGLLAGLQLVRTLAKEPSEAQENAAATTGGATAASEVVPVNG